VISQKSYYKNTPPHIISSQPHPKRVIMTNDLNNIITNKNNKDNNNSNNNNEINNPYTDDNDNQSNNDEKKSNNSNKRKTPNMISANKPPKKSKIMSLEEINKNKSIIKQNSIIKKTKMILDQITTFKEKNNIASKKYLASLNEEQKKIVKIKALKTKKDNALKFTEIDIQLKKLNRSS